MHSPAHRPCGGQTLRRRAAILLVTGLAGVIMPPLSSSTARAQAAASAPASAVTAAYLLNFVKFVNWPADVLDTTSPLTLCVADDRVSDAIEESLLTRPSTARPLALSRVSDTSIPSDCEVVYVGDTERRRVDTMLAALRGRSVLSVSSTHDFARRGGTIELFLADDGTMKFAVNPRAADEARLRVDARLLKLARIVSEAP